MAFRVSLCIGLSIFQSFPVSLPVHVALQVCMYGFKSFGVWFLELVCSKLKSLPVWSPLCGCALSLRGYEELPLLLSGGFGLGEVFLLLLGLG